MKKLNTIVKILLLSSLFIVFPLHLLATTWDTSTTATTASASTNPVPYDNDSDISTTLTVPGATSLRVTITGDIEDDNGCDYDYVTIEDASGKTDHPDTDDDRYCGIGINTTFVISGDHINLVFHSDGSVRENGVTVTIEEYQIGCDNSLDTSANSNAPWTIIPQMHNITTDTSTCISGNTAQSQGNPEKTDYYYFTVSSKGTLAITTSSPNNEAYHLRIGTSAGDNTYYGDSPAQSHNVSDISLNAGDTIYFYFKETGDEDDHYEMNLNFTVYIKSPPTISSIPNQTIQTDVAYNFDTSIYVTEPDGDVVTYIAIGLPIGLSIDANTGVISGASTIVGLYNVSITVTDTEGSASQSFTITVVPVPLVASPNDYNITTGTILTGNLINDDTGSGVDTGVNIVALTTATNGPTLGTLTIETNGAFTYTPDSNISGVDGFDYTITDDSGDTATASVNIDIGTDFSTGNFLPFSIINPPDTRNVIGDYKIAGNTVLCLTGSTTGYGGTCTDIALNTSNNFVSKYLDIDSNPGTWNSTSSYINFDAPYDPARGIIWAGLFWGGRIAVDKDAPIRYAVPNGSNGFTTTEVGQGSPVNNITIATTNAPNIKLKINSGSYSDILASTFHTYSSQGGDTYAAFANVTSTLQAATLGLGKHTFTVANLTTMEGREFSPGTFGGWSLVVIYAEDYSNGKPRNISIYNGFIKIENPSAPIQISGFKLPSAGTVQAQLSVFAGEGEYLYGRNPNSNKFDWMKISDQASTNYSYMPGKPAGTGIGNRDNMFDAQLDGILRDNIPGEFNDLSNNNVGVDVDSYDVSTLMTTYRDNDENISSIYIQMSKDSDYITPSMMAFSAELYVPNLCYDYTLDIDGHVLDSKNNEIKTPFGGFGKDLTTVIYLRSDEGDILLNDMTANYSIADSTQLSYHDCTTEISETGEYDYSNACLFTHNASNSGFGMYVGTGKTSSKGGVIDALESRYIKFDSEFHTSKVDTSFDFSLDYSVNYGSGPVPLKKTFTANDLCPPINTGYFPQPGIFNITDITNDFDEWNLYTQVSRRAFDLNIYAYANTNANFNTAIANDLNLTVEVEMIRADDFIRDGATACNNQHAILPDVDPKFVHFDESKKTILSYDNDDVNLAYRNTSMRVWYLSDINGTTYVDDHNCTRTNQAECINLYNREYVPGGKCATECRLFASSGNCYDCLRTSYGRKVCSRDNFAVRPESFLTTIYDSNQSTDITKPHNLIASSTVPSTPFSLIAGYNYRFDINATNHMDNRGTPRYLQHFSPGSPSHFMAMRWFPDGHTISGCNDVSDKNISVDIIDGTSVNISTQTSYVDKVEQIGKYRFHTQDQNWTSIDWDDNQMVHHTHPDNIAYFKSDNFGNDCLYNNPTVSSVGSTRKQGCLIHSEHTNSDASIQYDYLFAQYYPYTFNVDRLTAGARPSNDQNASTFVYINSLNPALYPNNRDENMSYNIQGTFTATGKNGLATSNFVENCYADSIDMSLYQSYRHTVPGDTPFLSYDLVDYNTTNPSTIIRSRSQDDFDLTNSNPSAALRPLTIPQLDEHFKKDMNGSITMDLGYNFARQNNTPLNPRHVMMKDFNLTYTTPPPPIFVDLQTDYKITGNKGLDQNITFLYARAKPGQEFYDDITATSVSTPVSVVVYCDLGYAICGDRNISTLNGQTNEATWWKSWFHDNLTPITGRDGNIVLKSNPTTALNSTNVFIDEKGEARDISVGIGAATPTVIIPVNLEWKDAPATSIPTFYTDRWLIYNPENANTPPVPFYRTRFIGGSGWAGKGKTGHVVGGTANVKKNKRLEW